MLDWLRAALTRRVSVPGTADRRVRIQEQPPSEEFVMILGLMILFFVGLVALEIVHMVVIGTWNDAIFNGIMLIVGSIVGSIFGYREA
jgi:hypothetical protein